LADILKDRTERAFDNIVPEVDDESN